MDGLALLGLVVAVAALTATGGRGLRVADVPPEEKRASVAAMMATALAVVVELHGADDRRVIAGLLAERQPDAWHREGLVLAIEVYRWQHRTFGPGTLERQGLHLARRSCGLDP